MKKQQGFSSIIVILMVVAVGLIAFTGYRVYTMMDEQNTNKSSGSTDTSGQVIESAEDLKQAEDSLNESDIESMDTSELDAIEAELL